MYLISHPLHLQFTSVSLKSTDSHHHHIFLLTWLKLDLYSLRTIFFYFSPNQSKNIYTKNTFTQKTTKISRQEGTQPQQTQDDTLYSCLTKRPVLSYSLPSYYKLISQKRRWFYLFAFAHLLFFFGALFSADGWIDLTSAVTLLCWCCCWWWWSKRESSPKDEDTFKMHSSHNLHKMYNHIFFSAPLSSSIQQKYTHTSRTKQSVYIVGNFLVLFLWIEKKNAVWFCAEKHTLLIWWL